MKDILFNRTCKCVLLFITFALMSACEYKDVFDAEYPAEQVYITGTYESIIYKVDKIIEKENAPFRYKIDLENNKLIIPLAVYRSSVKSETELLVKLGIDNDTIPVLIENDAFSGDNGSIVPEILPADKYTFETEIVISKGEELGAFELQVDIPFLLENLDKRYVLGISLLDANAKINEKMNLIVVDLLAAFVEANPDFNFVMNNKKPLEVAFANTSKHCLTYEWDFDDGSPVLNDIDPLLHTFPDVGIYNVKLTSKGTRGNFVTITKVVHIWENITSQYVKNAGDPFLKEGVVTGRVDNLADWLYTQNVLSTYNSTKKIYIGGYQMDNGGVMDFYANKSTGGALKNAKIYQTITSLPMGSYNAGFTPYKFEGENDCYFVVTKSATLPDIESIADDPDVIGYYHWNESIEEKQYGVEFSLDMPQDVTIGFVVSNTEGSRMKIKSVSLSK